MTVATGLPLGVKAQGRDKFELGIYPGKHYAAGEVEGMAGLFFGIYYTLTALHALHVIGMGSGLPLSSSSASGSPRRTTLSSRTSACTGTLLTWSGSSSSPCFTWFAKETSWTSF